MNRKAGVTAAAMLILSFIVGGLAGMAVEEGLGLDWFDFLDEDNEDNEQAEGRLLSGLDLSATQREQIEEILDDQEDRLEEYWESRIPEMRAIVAESYERIRPILTSDQLETFDRRVQAQGIPVPRGPD